MAARLVVLALAAGLVVLGTWQLRDAETDALPEFSPPYVEVQTEALGLSAEEVEQLITAPMEHLLLNGVAFLDGIRSESVNGLSSITLIFEPGTDPFEARQVVQERLTQQGLLAHLTQPPVIVQPLSSASRVLVVGLQSEQVSAIEMSVLARWTIRPKLLGIPGVANVSIFGQRERQLQVQVDPRRLARKGVTLQQVINTTGNALWVSPLSYLKASTPGTGGFVDTPSSRLEIRHVSPIVAPGDLRKVALEKAPGSSVTPDATLGDVARVAVGHQPLIGDAVVDDGPGLVMVIEKFPGANTLEVTEGVEEALATLAPGLDGITVQTDLFRPATFVDQARDNYTLVAGIGLLLALLLVALLLLHLRATFVVVTATLVSLTTCVVVLDQLGMALDSLVLAGLALATTVIVQDAVVDVEHALRQLRARPGADRAPMSVIHDAALETRRAMGYATAIVLVALAPLLVLDSLSRTIQRSALEAFALATLVSVLVALTVTPALCSVLLGRGAGAPSRPSRWLSALVARACRRTVRSGQAVAAVLTLGIVAGAVSALFVAPERPAMLPEFKEYDLVVAWQGDPGISREAMTNIGSELGAQLRELPGVKSVGGHVGRAVLSDRVNGIAEGELWVGVDPDADYADTVREVRAVTAAYDGASAEVRSYYSGRVDDGAALISETDRGRVALGDDEVVVRVYGEELDTLVEEADAIRTHLSELEEVTDVRVELPPVEPNLEVEVDLAAAERHGLLPGDVRRSATTLATGLTVGSLFEEQKVFDVVVAGRRDYFEDPARIGDLLIDTPGGGTVRLDEVADVRPGTSFSVINRESVSRHLDVALTVSGDRADAAEEVEGALENVEFPLEYHAEVLGEPESALDVRLLLLVAAGAFIAMVLLLQAHLRSWTVNAAAVAVIAFAMAGGVLALALFGGDLTIGAMLGLVAVLALGVRNLLGLVSRYHGLRQVEEVSFDRALAVRGAAEQAVAIVLAGGVVAALAVPVLVAGARPGLEVIHPMALVAVGGVVTATLGPLLLFPALYLRWGRRRQPDVLDNDLTIPEEVKV